MDRGKVNASMCVCVCDVIGNSVLCVITQWWRSAIFLNRIEWLNEKFNWVMRWTGAQSKDHVENGDPAKKFEWVPNMSGFRAALWLYVWVRTVCGQAHRPIWPKSLVFCIPLILPRLRCEVAGAIVQENTLQVCVKYSNYINIFLR